MCEAITAELKARVESAETKAVRKALEDDLYPVPSGDDEGGSGYRVVNRTKGSAWEITAEDVVPQSCECKADRFHYDGPCKHQVAVLSRLLSDPVFRFRAVDMLTDREGIEVNSLHVDYDDSTLEVVEQSDTVAKEVPVDGKPLPEYWRVNHGVSVSSDSPVLGVRFDGRVRTWDFPADVLTPV